MQNWCEEHQTKWFKTTKMQNYAHPIDGVVTQKGKQAWCNMPEEPAAHPATYESVEPHLVKEAKKLGAKVVSVSPVNTEADTKYKVDPAKTASIEMQVCLKCAKDLGVASIYNGKEVTPKQVVEATKIFAKLFDTGE